MKTLIAATLLVLITPAYANPFASFVCGKKETRVTFTQGDIVISGAIHPEGSRRINLKWSPDKRDGTKLLLNGRRCEKDV
jgi:hypothetical protein